MPAPKKHLFDTRTDDVIDCFSAIPEKIDELTITIKMINELLEKLPLHFRTASARIPTDADMKNLDRDWEDLMRAHDECNVELITLSNTMVKFSAQVTLATDISKMQ